jgi:hypothetical protein
MSLFPSNIAINANDDGSVEIDFAPQKATRKKTTGFYENLALDTDYGNLGVDILKGIEADIESRKERDGMFEKGLRLLGVRIEDASGSVTNEGSVSKAYHPILLEAVIRYQANASAELLPASGPVKVRNDHLESGSEDFKRAEDFEKDFNSYLTVGRKEYYPDTRRMLTGQGFNGNGFKKIYRCPTRKAPVSDYVSEQDLIISNDAVSLVNCGRVTHVMIVSPNAMKRLKYAGIYIDDDARIPTGEVSNTNKAIKATEGIRPDYRREDAPYTIYECYTDIVPDEYGIEDSLVPEGLPVPYKITIDKDSKKILAVYRDWKEGDEDYKRIVTFVKYGFIPSLGFYDWGFLHILGNTARVLTAALRLLIDAGQFSSFPGFLISDRASNQETTQIRISPGSGQTIRTCGLPIRDVAMPLPYQPPSAVLMQLMQSIAEDGKRLGMTAEVNVGEGRADVPVGTTIALIEQSTKVLSSVHKQNHIAQQEEFERLRELIAEDPECLIRGNKTPARKWQVGDEFNDLELTPASDPNVSSHIHRLMIATALVQLMGQFPELNRKEILDSILTTLNLDLNQFVSAQAPASAAPAVNPVAQVQAQKLQADLQIKQTQAGLEQQKLQLQAQDLQRKAAREDASLQLEAQNAKTKADAELHSDQVDQNIATMREETERMKLGNEMGRG